MDEDAEQLMKKAQQEDICVPIGEGRELLVIKFQLFFCSLEQLSIQFLP